MVSRRRNSRTSERDEVEMVASENPSVSVGDVTVDFNTRIQFPVTVPIGLKIALDKMVADAKARGDEKISAGTIARKAIADAVGYTGPLGGGRVVSVGLTEDEKKARQKARNDQRRELVKQMLEQYGTGATDDDEDDEDDDD